MTTERPDEQLDRLRKICFAFPDVTERPSHSAPTFFVGGKVILHFWQHGHHDSEFAQIWCAAPPGAQAELIATDPDRFFRPPYVGHRGWLGIRLDRPVDWTELAELCADAYRMVAPKRLVARLDAESLRP